jgi:hypothetical protein
MDSEVFSIGLFQNIDAIIENSDAFPIPVNVPSKIIINIDKYLVIKGYLPKDQNSSMVVFKCNDKIIGQLDTQQKKTLPYKLTPGKHELIVEGQSNAIWLFYKNPKYYRMHNVTGWCGGLLNQFNHLVNGITLAHLNKRHICNPRFLINYNNLDSILFSDIIDINHLNNLLITLKFDTNIEFDEKFEPQDWVKKAYYNNLVLVDGIEHIANGLAQDDETFIDLGLLFAMYTIFDKHLNDGRLSIYKEMRFTQQYYDVLNFCKINYLAESYNVVHLRLEDDWINSRSNEGKFEEVTNKLITSYNKTMDSLFKSDDIIYVATHLLKSDNKNNWFMKEFKEKYPRSVFSIPWRDNFLNITQGREIDALVDYIICRGSQKFIGLAASTFSIAINTLLKMDNKVSILI